MNSDQRFVANPLARTIERELRPGEILIWIGQPDPKRFSREVIRSCLFQLALMAIFIPVSLFVISRISQAEKTVVPMLLLVGGVYRIFCNRGAVALPAENPPNDLCDHR